jgi:hypothetical protein
MRRAEKCLFAGILILTLLSCSVFPSGRAERPPAGARRQAFFIVDGAMSGESAQMFLERYVLPTSVAAMQWTEFALKGREIRFEYRGGYRIARKRLTLTDTLGSHTVYGYELTVEPPGGPPSLREGPASHTVRFTYSSSSEDAGVLPQPAEQALLAAVRQDGRSSGWVRLDSISYLGSGRFKATVLVGR